MAAKKTFVHADPKCLGHEFVTDEILQGVSEKIRKESLRMLTKDEIRIELEISFANLPPCVQVVFFNQKCIACGQVIHVCPPITVILILREEIQD